MPHLTQRTRTAGLRWLGAAQGVLLAATLLVAVGAAPPPALLGQSLQEFADRRERLRAQASGAVVLVMGGVQSMEGLRSKGDTNLVYLTGYEGTGALALLPEGDPLGKTCALFVGAGYGGSRLEAVRQTTGIEAVYDLRSLWETLGPSLKQANTVYVTDATGTGRRADSAPARTRIQEISPQARVVDAARLIHGLRVRKSEGEIANLRRAIAATIRGFERAAAAIREGATELSIEGWTILGMREGGAAREGFPAVIGAGPNSVSIHNEPGDRPMQRDETVVVDIGGEVNYYTADLTRTFPVGRRFTPRARALYDLVLDVQLACERAIVPGKTMWSDLEKVARDRFQASPLRAADRQGNLVTMDRFFAHSIGHWLGMDVHDVGSRSGAIQPGSVLTIEPGLYIASENIGIRIEDDYLVTETGVERLSEALPRDAAAVERMMRKR